MNAIFRGTTVCSRLEAHTSSYSSPLTTALGPTNHPFTPTLSYQPFHTNSFTLIHPDHKMFLLYQALLLVFFACTSALSPAQWRSQSIYQVITDRFARTDSSTSASCDLQRYCGGTWQGLIDQLDYIQGMGFSAVSQSLKLCGKTRANSTRSGSRPLYRTWRNRRRTETLTTDIGRRTFTKSTRTSDLPRTWSSCRQLCMTEACT